MPGCGVIELWCVCFGSLYFLGIIIVLAGVRKACSMMHCARSMPLKA